MTQPKLALNLIFIGNWPYVESMIDVVHLHNIEL